MGARIDMVLLFPIVQKMAEPMANSHMVRIDEFDRIPPPSSPKPADPVVLG